MRSFAPHGGVHVPEENAGLMVALLNRDFACRLLSFNLMVERLDRTYAALAHPIRRRMLGELQTGPWRVTDLAAPFDVSLAAASKHIRLLERAALVSRIVRGREHVLALDARPLLDARAWIDSYRSFWEERLDALDEHLRRQR
jgi:DNA-binding transcriptional ArsR family regulator